MASAVPRSRRLVPADNRQTSRTGNHQVPGESIRKVPGESTRERLIDAPGRTNPESCRPSLAADNRQTAGKMTIAIFVAEPLQSSSWKASIMLGNRQSKRTGNRQVPGRKAHKAAGTFTMASKAVYKPNSHQRRPGDINVWNDIVVGGTSAPAGGIPQTTAELETATDREPIRSAIRCTDIRDLKSMTVIRSAIRITYRIRSVW
ncbi:hypothetical protein BDZ89DRAFT_1051121 [Hymenopellis radicata]|nr:hypothetical protein BDZ89DRAFT_1051121 [Hymenopellis radicata]